MPRSTQSPLGRVLDYVRKTSLEVLEETFPLIQDIVRERRSKSLAAKKLARKGPATDATATAASTAAPATPGKRRGPKPGTTKRRKAQTAPVAPPAGDTFEEYGGPEGTEPVDESELAPV